MKIFKQICLLIGLLLAIAVLSGCLEMTSEVRLNSDGSGIFQISSIISSDLSEMIAMDDSINGSFIVLSENELRDLDASMEGVQLIDYYLKEDRGVAVFSATLSFESRADLEQVLEEAGMRLLPDTNDKQMSIEILSDESLDIELDDMTMDMADSIRYQFIFHAPGKIIEVSPDSIMVESRKVYFEIPLLDAIQNKEAVRMSVQWQ
ncbi:MAG: hypothetical protein D6B26_07935 [Spirochaetaceae bacterium]|nr:MAG: hypothetical protein D6B26_07935 [Spirochaetaceae bacterium]